MTELGVRRPGDALDRAVQVIVDRDGHQLVVDVVGEGPPVLLAHGMSGTGHRDWGQLVDRLAPRFRCIVPDLRGHGRSSYRPEGISYEAMADDVAALVHLLTDGTAHLIGFSMGGEVVLDATLRHPGLARSVVLAAPCLGRGPDYPHDIGPTAPLPDRWPTSLREPHLERHGAEHWRTLLADVSRAWMDRPELGTEELSSIDVPLLAVIGRDEEPFKHRQTAVLLDAVACATLRELDGSHAVHLESATAFGHEVLAFLERVELG